MPGTKEHVSGVDEISITEALVSLRSKKPASLYVFAPGDDYFIPQAKEAARSQVAENAQAFDYAEFDGYDSNVDGITEFLETEGFGSGRKVLIINDLEEKAGKRLGGLAAMFLRGGTSTLIFADPARLPTVLLSKAFVITNYAVSPANVRNWVRKRLGGREIEGQAMHELIERTAGSFFLMRSEIEKLLSYTTGTITIADVRDVVPRCHVAAASDLVEAVSLRKVDQTNRAFKDLAVSGAAGTAILYDVEQGFMRLLNAKLVSRSIRPKADLRSWCLRAQHQYLDDYTLNALLAAAGHIKLQELEEILQYLEDIEYQTKKGLISNPLTALERLLSLLSVTMMQ